MRGRRRDSKALSRVDVQKISAKSLHSIAAVRNSFVESPLEPSGTSVEEYAMVFESNVV
jgi:hypothetical protein